MNQGDIVEFNYVLRRANGYYVFRYNYLEPVLDNIQVCRSRLDRIVAWLVEYRSTIDLFGGLSEPAVFPLGKGKV